MLSLKFATIVVVVVSAALFVSVATADVVLPLETRMQIEEAATSVSGSSSHYESPPCQSDEKAVRIMGIDGSFCSPSCSDGPCPEDVPDGVTASPLCALQSPEGDKFCAILCKPGAFLRTVGGGECGPMSCQPIPQAAGMGICVYDDRQQESDVTTVVGAM